MIFRTRTIQPGSPPHMRGKDEPRNGRNKTITVRRGSPPHMRGKVSTLTYEKKRQRITPAHAGKRKSSKRQRSQLQDHPRTCGEKQQGDHKLHRSSGSPPHMRGKVFINPAGKTQHGITPAHAGKRKERNRRQYLHKDHPRTCGEKTGSGHGELCF